MTYRPVDISAQAPLDPPTIAGSPRLGWVDIDQLLIDEAYQRPLEAKNWRVIRKIATEFDWSRFTPVMVSQIPGGGQYALIDGQHRAHAAALAGLTRIPAMIVLIAPGEQAAAFSAINTQRTGVSAFHILRAALVSGEPWARAATGAVSDAGCQLMTSNYSAASKKPGQIFTVGLVREHVVAGRGAVITQVLTAIRASGRAEEVQMYQARILRPLLAVLALQSPISPSLLERFISDTDLIRARNTVGDLRARAEYTRLSDYELAKRAFRALLHQFLRSDARAA